jgi:hypothetical protein
VRKKLQRLHAGQIARINAGAMSRATTTTYNANAADAAERAKSSEDQLRALVIGTRESVAA